MSYPEFRVERHGSETLLMKYAHVGDQHPLVIAFGLTEAEVNRIKRSQERPA